MQEIFADYHGYSIGNLGTIIGPKGRPLSPSVTPTGYHKVVLVYNRRKHCMRVHRLVAQLFVVNPRPQEYTQIDHINNDRADNRASNLRWTTCAENCKWKYELRRMRGLPTLTQAEAEALEKAHAARRKKAA